MSKVYMLTEADLDRLLTLVDRDPDHGERGGSSAHLSVEERAIYRRAHRFYNYQIRNWIDEVKK